MDTVDTCLLFIAFKEKGSLLVPAARRDVNTQKLFWDAEKLKNKMNEIHTFRFCPSAMDKETRNVDHDLSGRVSYN